MFDVNWVVRLGACVAGVGLLLSGSVLAAQLAAQQPCVGEGAGAGSRAGGSAPSPVRIPFFEHPPVIDGRPDEAVWAGAARLCGFVQTQPGDNARPTHPTELRIGYDSRHLYLAVIATDDPGQVRATLAKRDDVLADDHVRVYLDTFDDRRRAYLLVFNPLGVQQDGIWTEGAEPDYSLDLPMASKGEVTETGYAVEVAIPFRSLRYGETNAAWGVHVLRQTRRQTDEVDSWMPLVRGRTSFLAQAGRITGLERIEWARPVEVIPSIALSRADSRPPAGDDGLRAPLADGDVRVDPGLTAKVGLVQGITLDAAVNPDFAQVEADERVVTANQRFPILFEEKRPFFLEGIELLETPLRAVHTRTIVDPDAAVKLSGTRGRSAFTAILASDAAPGNLTAADRADPEQESLAGRNATIAVVRAQRGVGAHSALGVVATEHRFAGRYNRLGGVDGRLALDPRTTLTFQLIGAASRDEFYDPDLDRSVLRDARGLAYHAAFRRSGRHWNWGLSAEGVSPDYLARTGFTRQTDVATWRLDTRYDAEPRPDAGLVSWSLTHTALAQIDWSGRLKYAYLFPGLLLRLRAQSYVHAYAYVDYLKLFEEEFGPRRSATQAGAFAGDPERSTVFRGLLLQAGSTPTKRLSLSASVDRSWDTFDYDFGAPPRFPRVSPAALADPDAPLDPGPGHSLDLATALTWQPTDNLQLSLRYTKSRLVRADTRRVAYDENLLSTRGAYQFSRSTFLRVRGDYSSLHSTLFGQLLWGWTPAPGTALYIGYSEDLDRAGAGAGADAGLAGARREWSRNARTLLAKMSYAIRSW